MNGRVGSSELAGVVGKWGVDGVNENGEHLVDVCAERGVVPFKHFLSAQDDPLILVEKEGGECGKLYKGRYVSYIRGGT